MKKEAPPSADEERRCSERHPRWFDALATQEHRPALVTRTLSGLGFVGALVLPEAINVEDLVPPAAWASGYAVRELQPSLPHVASLIPHAAFHAATSIVGLAVAIAILALAVALGPYRQGENWAWWALALAGCANFAAKVWGILSIYPHPLAGGDMAVQVQLPALLWLLAVALSWKDFHTAPSD